MCRRLAHASAMSALPPIADMCSALGDVRFVPIADISQNPPTPETVARHGSNVANEQSVEPSFEIAHQWYSAPAVSKATRGSS